MWVRVPRLPFDANSCARGRAAKVPAFQAGQAGSIPAGHFPSDPVVQRRRLLAYTQITMVRDHPGSLSTNAQVRQMVERLGLRLSGCEFESHSGHLRKHGSVGNWKTTLFQTQRCCGFESHSSYSSTRPRGAARSARHPVKVEIRGSNPLGDAFRQHGAVRNLAKRRSSNLRGLWVRLPPASLDSFASAEHWRAQVAVTHPPSGFGGSTPSRRTHFQFLSSRVGQCPSGFGSGSV